MTEAKLSKANEQEPPFVSVIVPVYNDPGGISETLDSLIDQTYPRTRYEIIVVDNGSTDETPGVIQERQRQHPHLLRTFVESAIQSSYAARNRGIRNARGDILAFVDADMWVEKDWLHRVVDEMRSDGIDYLGCNVEIRLKEVSPVALYVQSFAFPVQSYLRDGHFAPTCCLVVKKSLFDIVGLFDDRMISSGDVEFGKRVYDCGIPQHFAQDIVMYHPARALLTSWAKKQFRVGRGWRQGYRYYPDKFGSLRRGILNPRSYLPLRPAAFSRLMRSRRQDKEVNASTMLLFYFLTWWQKWLCDLGYFYERLVHP